MSVLSKLLRILNRSSVKKVIFVFLFLLAAVSSFLEILPSEIIGRFSSTLAAGRDEGVMTVILGWCAFYFLVVAIGAAVRNFFCYATSRVANTLIRDIRDSAFAKLLSVDLAGLGEPDSGYFVNMINGNCGRLETVFSVALFTLVSDVFDLFWISVFIFAMDWKLLAIMGAFVPILYLLGRKSSKMQRKLAVERIDMESRMISRINETCVNRPAIRVFGGQRREEGAFQSQSEDYRRKSNQADATLSIFYALEKTIRYIAISLVIFVTALEITKGRCAVGSLVSIVLYSQKFYAPITNIIRYIQMLQKGMASVDALEEFLDCEDMDPEENLTFSEETGFACIHEVQVRSQGKTILPAVSFRLEAPSLNIVTGASGCGKSTLVKALLGELRLSGGEIRINTALRGKPLFSYASQDTEVFTGTILENVLYPQWQGKTTEAEALLTSLGFTRSQWNRSVGEAGSTLSGGEKKRIAFARAVLKESSILILDEITSNLDEANEAVIAKMIVEESKKRCVLLITHKEHPAFAGANVHRIKMLAVDHPL